jgi:ACS family pantothenate transporter-like MFS transporter
MGNRFVQYFRGEQHAPGERKLVSGMREELGFKGNQLNQINTVFTVGYTIGQVPCNILLYYVKPRIFFPSCMVRHFEIL